MASSCLDPVLVINGKKRTVLNSTKLSFDRQVELPVMYLNVKTIILADNMRSSLLEQSGTKRTNIGLLLFYHQIQTNQWNNSGRKNKI